MTQVKGLLLTAIVFFSSCWLFETSTSSESDSPASTYLYSFAHLSEPEVDTNKGRDRVYFENQTKWLALQDNIKAVVITGDFMETLSWANLTAGTINETVWGWVEEGVERLRNAGKVVIPVLGNWDAFYNETYDGGKSDYRAFLKYAAAPAGILTQTPNYTVTLDTPIRLFFITLAFQWRKSPEGIFWEIPQDQITWMGRQLNSTSLPAVIALHPPPSRFALAYRDQGVNDAVWIEVRKHSNVFLILYGHDQERSFRIYEARDGHPIYLEGKLVPFSQYGGQAEIQIYDVYSDRIKSYTFSPWLNKYFTGYEGDTFEIPFGGIMKSKSGLLKRNDFTSRQGSETGQEFGTPKFNYDDYVSPPSSVDLGYNDMVKRFLPKHHRTFWLQTYRKFRTVGVRGACHINILQRIGNRFRVPLSSRSVLVGENYYFHPNASDTSKNVTVSDSDWYSVIYYVNESAEMVDVHLFFENGTLVESWFNFLYISMEGFPGPHGTREIMFFDYARMDDYLLTNGTSVSFPPGTVLTLSNGTKIFPDGAINLLTFGTLMLRNVIVQIGDSTTVMDLYGGDSVNVFNLNFWTTPIASFTYSPSKPAPYQMATFNASASYDPDGFITNYTWDFGDGKITIVSNTIITHVYSTNGTFLINLTVTDNDGLASFTTDYITVKNQHDVAITNVAVSTFEITTGENVFIDVEVTNEGENPEIFDVVVYYDDGIIDAKTSIHIGIQGIVTVPFIWNTTGVEPSNYTMWAEASVLEGETDTTDNSRVAGTVVLNKILSLIYISVNPNIIKLGSETTISGYIDPTQTGVDVTIGYSLNGGTWRTLTVAVTNEEGLYSYVWKPEETGTYSLSADWSGTFGILHAESEIEIAIVEQPEPSPNITLYAVVGSIIVAAMVALVYLVTAKRPPPTLELLALTRGNSSLARATWN